ncbi:lipoprotein LppV [Mycobacteroides abscessus subsp. massiliense]|nr:LppA family lipoprotein [Mycobacteroides abscessus]MDM2429419.1 LppA family lipoprotein [Mycobacteroides abscessus]SKR16512.1 lipoprotein LppV [Mycobacteroides abscessus subsp. massiliense]SKR76620.1 lipoprotein LppV [Mycobacteroides abscessus subsp. massiliense]SKT99890.1 lipoprotein LppV [Mycobacteroides abscessus subsp. massiliense]SKU21974.1 lipoprotein LppV [Mycobacteroides abscessus subsp. massiliense]
MDNHYAPTPPTEAAKALEELKTLPSLEETKARIQAAVDEIIATTTQLVPSLKWQRFDDGETGNCESPYDQSEGKRVFLPKYVSEVPVPEENWNQVYEIARKTAAEIGATKSDALQDIPGKHDFRFYNDTGTAIRIGSQKTAMVAGYTGCRLPAAKK